MNLTESSSAPAPRLKKFWERGFAVSFVACSAAAVIAFAGEHRSSAFSKHIFSSSAAEITARQVSGLKNIIFQPFLAKLAHFAEPKDPPAFSQSEKTIILDPGHGGYMPRTDGDPRLDPGATTYYKGRHIAEARLNWEMATEIKSRLESRGYHVIMTRDAYQQTDKHILDRDPDGAATGMGRRRTGVADNAIAFISLHQDAHVVARHNGPRVNYRFDARPIDRKFAQTVAASIGGRLEENPRPIAVLTPGLNTRRPAILIEATNLRDRRDMALVAGNGYIKLADRIADGLDRSLQQLRRDDRSNRFRVASMRDGHSRLGM